MRKILWVACLSLGCQLQSYALTPGIYLGGAIGAYGYQSRLNVLEDSDGNHLRTAYRIGRTHLSGTLLAGYTVNLNQQLALSAQLEGEAIDGNTTAISLNGTDDDGDIGTFHYQEKHRYDFGISVLPRLALNSDSHAFLKLGWRRGYFKTDIKALEVDGHTGQASSAALNQNQSRNGFEYGLGLQTAVCPNVDVFVLLSQTSYASKTVQLVDDRFTSQPRINRGQIGLVWHPAQDGTPTK